MHTFTICIWNQQYLKIILIIWFFYLSGTIANTRKEELAIQAIKDKEAAELKAAKKAAEEAGKLLHFDWERELPFTLIISLGKI